MIHGIIWKNHQLSTRRQNLASLKVGAVESFLETELSVAQGAMGVRVGGIGVGGGGRARMGGALEGLRTIAVREGN